MLRIFDILVGTDPDPRISTYDWRICIRTCYFRQWLLRRWQLNYFLMLDLYHFSKIKNHKEVTKQYKSRFVLLFLFDDRGCGSGSVPFYKWIRIQEAQIHPDPQHWFYLHCLLYVNLWFWIPSTWVTDFSVLQDSFLWMDVGHDQLLVVLFSTFFLTRVTDILHHFNAKKYNGTVPNMGFARNMAMSDGWHPL